MKQLCYLFYVQSEKVLTELEHTKGTVAMCCGHVAFQAPSELIASRIETSIVKTILPLFKGIRVSFTSTRLYSCSHSSRCNHFLRDDETIM